jgi:radical SAM superfamily enzyme YgiQ (UPF0313 family)
MKILLIAPASGHWRGLGKKWLFNGKTFRFSMLSLLSVAALTPKAHELRLIDEQIEDVPWGERFDLVGITAMTATAPRAYALCRRFRQSGVPVVLGGFHPTFNIDEAARHADAVVAGPAGGAWPRVLEDAERGALKSVYRGDPGVEVPLTLPRHLLKRSRYVSVNTCHATLGCRNECAFCSVTAFYKGQRYQRDIGEIVRHLCSFDEPFFIFIDDNLTQDREYALRLFEAIAPLGKKWATQASIEIADDPELLTWMRRAGCVGVFVGLESFSQAALCTQNKTLKPPQYYKDAVAAIHRHGMVVEAGLIFGFDTDPPAVFESTLAMLDEIEIDAMQASILTPLPGTRLFERMRHRVVDFDWEHYDYKRAVFEPALMSRQDLEAGLEWINKRFYSPWRILRRLARWLHMVSGLRDIYLPIAILALNVAYWGRQFQFKVKGYNPAREVSCNPLAPEPVQGAQTGTSRRPRGSPWLISAPTSATPSGLSSHTARSA